MCLEVEIDTWFPSIDDAKGGRVEGQRVEGQRVEGQRVEGWRGGSERAERERLGRSENPCTPSSRYETPTFRKRRNDMKTRFFELR